MIAVKTQAHWEQEIEKTDFHDVESEEYEANFVKYKNSVEMIDLKDSMLNSILQINSYFNAYKFLKNDDMAYSQKKADKKAAEIFQAIRFLVKDIKNTSFWAGGGYVTGEEIFRNICARKNPAHVQALSLIQSTTGKSYTLFKVYLEKISRESYYFSGISI